MPSFEPINLKKQKDDVTRLSQHAFENLDARTFAFKAREAIQTIAHADLMSAQATERLQLELAQETDALKKLVEEEKNIIQTLSSMLAESKKEISTWREQASFRISQIALFIAERIVDHEFRLILTLFYKW